MVRIKLNSEELVVAKHLCVTDIKKELNGIPGCDLQKETKGIRCLCSDKCGKDTLLYILTETDKETEIIFSAMLIHGYYYIRDNKYICLSNNVCKDFGLL